MFQRILLAWDGSPVSVRAFDAGIDVARRYGADLVAVSVAHSPAHAETAADRRETTDAAHRHLSSSFEEVADRARRVGIDISHEIIDGETPARAIHNYAQSHGFDLIICGHHRSGRVGRLLLKDVALELIQDGTPVLVIGDDTG